jgi:hypothetical protein
MANSKMDGKRDYHSMLCNNQPRTDMTKNLDGVRTRALATAQRIVSSGLPGQREKSALMKQLRYKAVRQKTPSSP